MSNQIALDDQGFAALAPDLVVPPAAHLVNGSSSVFFAANGILFDRFYLPAKKTYRYVNFRIATASGNIEVGVVKLSGTGHLTYTKVMTSGVIASPSAGSIRQDCGATSLDPGDYALFFQADNTTISVPTYSTADTAGARWTANLTGGSMGVPTTGSLVAWGQRGLLHCSLEADI